MSFLRQVEQGVMLSVRAQPRAARNEICEPIGGELKVKVTAPPVDSAANKALVSFLANVLGCPKRHVQLVRGQASRHKQFLVTGLSFQAVEEKLTAARKAAH